MGSEARWPPRWALSAPLDAGPLHGSRSLRSAYPRGPRFWWADGLVSEGCWDLTPIKRPALRGSGLARQEHPVPALGARPSRARGAALACLSVPAAPGDGEAVSGLLGSLVETCPCCAGRNLDPSYSSTGL